MGWGGGVGWRMGWEGGREEAVSAAAMPPLTYPFLALICLVGSTWILANNVTGMSDLSRPIKGSRELPPEKGTNIPLRRGDL